MSETRTEAIRAAISNAYYEARDSGQTMEIAADIATSAVLAIEAESSALDVERLALREALAAWDAIEGSDLADRLRAFIAAGKMADAIRDLLAKAEAGRTE